MDRAELERTHAEMRAAYWERKDVGEVVRLARAVLDAPRPDDAAGLGWLKAIAYDLASFTWPGWDEPGISIEPDQLAAGFDAARLNLELAVSLERPDDKVAIAHWIVGAHQLAAGDREAARASFEESERFAASADDPGGELLARGFAALASRDRAALDAVRAELAAVEDGPSYVEQLDTAAHVFG